MIAIKKAQAEGGIYNAYNVTQQEKPKAWWSDVVNGKVWIEQNKKREDTGRKRSNSTLQSQDMVIFEIFKRQGVFQNILEVGAGSGRLIGNISNEVDIKCSSVDINSELSKYVSEKFPKVKTNVGDICKLPFEDNSFDLVFTYQVLQHIPPEEIKKALSELQRVAKKEVWCWEGIGRVDGYGNGAMTHKAHNGSWVWKIDEIVDCYDVSIPENKNIKLERQRLYKIKK